MTPHSSLNKIKHYFFQTKHRGILTSETTHCIQTQDIRRGYRIKLFIESDGNQIQYARFLAYGDPYVIAALAWLCDYLETHSETTIRTLNASFVATAIDLNPSRLYAAMIVQHLIKRWRNNMPQCNVTHLKWQDPNITLTDNAKQRIKTWLKKSNGQGVRIHTQATGCSGLEYVTNIVNTIDPEDLVSIIEPDLKIYIPKSAYPHLKNVRIDYVKTGLNFKFVFNNPNATGICGCGESFTIHTEFYKE